MSLRLLNPSSVAPSGPFSHGLVIPAEHDIIVTAGQIGTTDPQGTIPDSYEEQVVAAVKNLKDVLAEAGAAPKDIIKLTYYIVDYGGGFNESPMTTQILITLTRHFSSSGAYQCIAELLGWPPAGTALIGVAKLGNPKLKFEIEAIAALKSATAPQAGDLA
ncbi:hypothetical protein LTR72_003570 [Exophiala xenobiotica]|nr:hypothetical protein LTR41_004426 [Exophiala xenobiotica]KAK5225667.1 hypothetical protein LTR72_003570 [Exophiala xenobiotica]KAK5280412.1 hypothetical protein LTR40_006384 [Exophiala xenobiotica]KAK5298487.1 hypothetical protein LTR14_002338 [Exophiala xenobiotica]KAK5330305.1 hypothetical protein LTR93_001894 [Exophiala xenobiotica]